MAFYDYITARKNSNGDEFEPLQRPVWLPTARALKGKLQGRDTDSAALAIYPIYNEAVQPALDRRLFCGAALTPGYRLIGAFVKKTWS